MINYQYQIVRYIHDRVTGEFVNVGLVFYDPKSFFLRCKVVTKYSRISHFFTDVKGHFLITSLKHFENEINDFLKSKESSSEKYFENIDSITKRVLPKDDSALVCTEMKKAIDIDIEKAFEDMFNRIVDRYTEESISLHNDNYAWTKFYKNHFKKYGLTKKLKKHSVKTHTDIIDFDKAWKNGVWNCYQSLSLDLKREESIKNKVYRWSGILRQLELTNEDLHLFFLTTTPKTDHKIQNLVKEVLTAKNKSNVKVTLVKESEAEKFAAQVKKEMEKSEA